MTLRTVTVIWWAVLILGDVAWCSAQGIANPPLLFEPDSCVTVARIDSGDTVITVSNQFGQSVKLPLYSRWPKPLTLDSLVVLWDEYMAEVREADVYGMTATCDSAVVFRFKPTLEGFMHFIRRKAGE